jgi:hypothetical protein
MEPTKHAMRKEFDYTPHIWTPCQLSLRYATAFSRSCEEVWAAANVNLIAAGKNLVQENYRIRESRAHQIA